MPDLAEKGADFLDKRAEALMVRQPDWDKWLEPEEIAKLRTSDTYAEQVRRAFLEVESENGQTLPWAKADGFRFRPGEMTIWTGYNGHRKSMVIGQVLLGLIAQGSTACIASLEMKPVKSLKRMIRQYVGVDEPTQNYQQRFFDWVTGSLWFYDHVGTAKAERMIAVARYAMQELGVRHVVIDSLMKCGIGEDDYNKQKWFVDALHSAAHDLGGHVHLVAHAKKPPSGQESMPSTKYGVAGSANITNIPDNVLVVFKDMEKEHDYDLILRCEKQREGESEPRFIFHFDERSLQHKSFSNGYPMRADDWERGQWK